MKIISVVGARPNFMKIAPLLRAIYKHNLEHRTLNIEPILVHTGQHYDYEMSQVFFQDLEIPEPDIHLGVGAGTHAEQTGRIMIEFEKVLYQEKPDLVIVVGDVNSTLAAALAAVKLHIPVAHLEAGLRSFDRTMPEEINRLLTDAISDYLFTPSPDANENLKKEGIPENKIFFVGNIMVDSLLYNKARAAKSDILERLGLITTPQSPIPSHQSAVKPYALLTLHRPDNVDEKESLLRIIEAVKEISRRIPIIFPVHPRTQQRLKQFGLLTDSLAIYAKSESESESRSQSQSHPITSHQSPITSHQLVLIHPLGYLDFLNLEMNAKFVMTDSGGIQEETTALNIPCLTLRNTTERPVTITQGTNTIAWNSTETIVAEAFKIIEGKGKRGCCPDLWDGRTAERIVEILAVARELHEYL